MVDEAPVGLRLLAQERCVSLFAWPQTFVFTTPVAKHQMADVGAAQTLLVDNMDPLLDDAEEAESKVLL